MGCTAPAAAEGAVRTAVDKDGAYKLVFEFGIAQTEHRADKQQMRLFLYAPFLYNHPPL